MLEAKLKSIKISGVLSQVCLKWRLGENMIVDLNKKLTTNIKEDNDILFFYDLFVQHQNQQLRHKDSKNRH